VPHLRFLYIAGYGVCIVLTSSKPVDTAFISSSSL